MSEVSKRLGGPLLPSVNLLPAEIAAKRAMRAVQISALFAVLIAIGLVVLGYIGALTSKAVADRELAEAQVAQEQAISDRDAKVGVYNRYRAREIEEYALAQIGYGEVDQSHLSTALLGTANSETSFDALTINVPSALGYQGLVADPVFGGGVGSFEFEARALSQEDATALIGRLEEVTGIERVNAYVETYQADGGEVYWRAAGAGVISEVWLTERLLPVDGVSGLNAQVIGPAISGHEVPTTEDSLANEPTPEVDSETGDE